jgi:hypothetical protein
MADVLISQLPVASSVNTSDLIIVDQNISGVLTTKTATIAQLIGLPVMVPNVVANTLSTNALDGSGYSAEFLSYNGSGSIVPNSSTAFKSARGTLAAPIALVSGDVIGNDDYFGFNGSSFAYSASIDIVAAGNFTNISTPTQFNINVTAPGTTVPTLAATIGQGFVVNTLTPNYYAFSALINNNVVNGTGIQLGGGRGTQAVPTPVLQGDIIGNIDFFGYGTSFVEGGSINAFAKSLWSATNAETDLAFSNTPSGSIVAIERMRLDSTGTLLIGQTTGGLAGLSISAATAIESNATSAAGAYNFIGYGASAANTNNASVGLYSQTRGTAANTAGDTIGNMDVFGWNGTAYAYTASLDVLAVSTFSGTNFQSAFVFNTTPLNAIAPTLTATLSSTAFALSVGVQIVPATVAGIKGTTLADNAVAGAVGEVISSTVAAIATGLTTATPLNVTSIALTAGDWDVYGSFVITGAATTSFTIAQSGMNITTATLPATNLLSFMAGSAFVPGGTLTADNVPTQRINVSVATTVYLVAQSTFTVSTAGAGGTLLARRVR